MRSLLLTEDPGADLLSTALLEEARASLGGEVVTAAEGARPDRAVLAGAFLRRAALEAALATAAGLGLPLLGWNLSLEGDAARAAPPAGLGVLDRAEAIHARDHRTLNVLTLWRVRAPLRLRPYPERHLAPDRALALLLPPGPLLGVCFRGGAPIRAGWRARIPALRHILSGCEGWPVLPLPLDPPESGSAGGDAAGIRDFCAEVLPGARLALPGLLEPRWWRRGMTPARLHGLVAACAAVVTQRDLPAAFAIAAGVPVQGIALGADRRIITCMATLANELPPGSALHHPPAGGDQASRASSSARA